MEIMAWSVFWCSLGILLYIYLGYAIVLQILAKVFPFRHEVDETFQPVVSILFPHGMNAFLCPPRFRVCVR